MNCKECIYCFMDRHPVLSLFFMAIPMAALFLIHTQNMLYITEFIVGGFIYLILALALAGYLSGATGTFRHALCMALNGDWDELSKSRSVSTHATVAATLSMYASFVHGLLPDGPTTSGNFFFISISIAVLYIYITERSRVYLGRHTEYQVSTGTLVGVVITMPIFVLFMLGVRV